MSNWRATQLQHTINGCKQHFSIRNKQHRHLLYPKPISQIIQESTDIHIYCWTVSFFCCQFFLFQSNAQGYYKSGLNLPLKRGLKCIETGFLGGRLKEWGRNAENKWKIEILLCSPMSTPHPSLTSMHYGKWSLHGCLTILNTLCQASKGG